MAGKSRIAVLALTVGLASGVALAVLPSSSVDEKILSAYYAITYSRFAR